MIRSSRIVRPTDFDMLPEGVPNPMVTVERGWPTRLHGPNFVYVQPSYRYRRRPFQKAPFLGLGQPESWGSGCNDDSMCSPGSICCGYTPYAWCVPEDQCEQAGDLAANLCANAGGEISKNAAVCVYPGTDQPIDSASSVTPDQSSQATTGSWTSEKVTVPVVAAVAVGGLALLLLLSR